MRQLKKLFQFPGFLAPRIFLLFIIISLFVFTSCAKYDAQTASEGNYEEYEKEMIEDKPVPEEPGTDFFTDSEDDTETTAKTREQRMRVYFGFLKLRVAHIREARSAVSTLADNAGGYVESSYENTIVVRIPRELFTEIMAKLMDMGEVLYKSIETYDVTEMFQDFTARLDILKRTRGRLYTLLEKTNDVKERLKILKEIRRLSEEIEKISMTLETIQRLVSFSRITVEFEQRLTDLSYENRETIPFSWIASLDPFYTTLPRLKGNVTIPVGDEFAVFDNKKYFFAESTGGVRIRIGTAKNKPEGDAAFWQEALEYHCARFYSETESFDLGNFKTVLFKSKDREPFYYMTCVAVKGKKIFVCEVLFPDSTSFDNLGESVKKYIKEAEIQ
jgi:hypothetical protein